MNLGKKMKLAILPGLIEGVAEVFPGLPRRLPGVACFEVEPSPFHKVHFCSLRDFSTDNGIGVPHALFVIGPRDECVLVRGIPFVGGGFFAGCTCHLLDEVQTQEERRNKRVKKLAEVLPQRSSHANQNPRF